MNTFTMTFVMVVLIIEAVRFEIDRRGRKKQATAQTIQILEQSIQISKSIEGAIKDAGSKIVRSVDDAMTAISTGNAEFIKMIQSEFEDELIKAQEERDRAVDELNIFISAIRSLDNNYRKKIQFQIDQIIGKRTQKPATSDKGRPAQAMADEDHQDDTRQPDKPDKEADQTPDGPSTL